MSLEQNPYNLPPERAINYLLEKLLVPSADWRTIRDELINHAFFVSSVDSSRLLEDLYDEVVRFLEEDGSYQEFLDNFSEIADRHGWQPQEGVSRRARIVAQTNLDTAQAAAKYREISQPHMREAFPYVRVSPSFARNPRPYHKVLEGNYYRTSDILNTPEMCFPCGFGCRHSLTFLRRIPSGATVSEIPRLANGTVGVVLNGKEYPIADPGWNYIPGLPQIGTNSDALIRSVDPSFRPQQVVI